MGVGDFHIDFDDIEKGFGQSTALYPGIAADENKLRWGFIRKVYGILSVQFFQSNPASVLVLAFLPLVCK
jgi:hypothetical protein